MIGCNFSRGYLTLTLAAYSRSLRCYKGLRRPCGSNFACDVTCARILTFAWLFLFRIPQSLGRNHFIYGTLEGALEKLNGHEVWDAISISQGIVTLNLLGTQRRNILCSTISPFQILRKRECGRALCQARSLLHSEIYILRKWSLLVYRAYASQTRDQSTSTIGIIRIL